VEATGSHHLPPVQFVDDITTPCPSAGAVRAVLSEEASSACSRRARAMKPQFNYGVGKTCALLIFGAPPPPHAGCPVVLVKRLLGVLVDGDLSFLPLLREVAATGNDCFGKLLHAAQSGGFSIPVAAAKAPSCVESAVLCAAPL
jgi:hypothetical protein